MTPVILWFRQDLRLDSNPALQAAVQSEQPIIPIYILDDKKPGDRPYGGAQRWWLHHSLTSLNQSLKKIGSQLIFMSGDVEKILTQLIEKTKASAIYWNRMYEPVAIERDRTIKKNLREQGLHVESFNSQLLFEPDHIKNQSKKPFKVFTQFWKTCATQFDQIHASPAAPKHLISPKIWPKSESLEDWNLLPTHPNWAGEFNVWTPGEHGAQSRLQDFLDKYIHTYKRKRDFPGLDQTSRLSPHLHFGEITPHQIYEALKATFPTGLTRDAECFLSEVGWREFAHHLIYHFPDFPTKPFRPEFEHFKWDDNPKALQSWKEGKTGYPIVDAGMRQLWRTGWLHNRMRMVVASFLIKDLFINWRDGEEWFWDTLVDGDLANNSAGWQWVAGSGADAAPYFRIFNPFLQSVKFDPDGDYIRKWIPEIAKLPSKYIHQPWTAPSDVLEKAGIQLDQTYPSPIVDHYQVRTQAMERYQVAKSHEVEEEDH